MISIAKRTIDLFVYICMNIHRAIGKDRTMAMMRKLYVKYASLMGAKMCAYQQNNNGNTPLIPDP